MEGNCEPGPLSRIPTIRKTVIKGTLYYNIVSMFRVCFPACQKVHLVNSAFGFHLRLFTCAPYTSWTNYRNNKTPAGRQPDQHTC